MIKDLPVSKDPKAAMSTFVGSVSLPPRGTVLTAADQAFIALFENAFIHIDSITAELEFADDLWDSNETWYSPEFGGQQNLDGESRSSASLTTQDCGTFFRFAAGRFRFNLHCENGTMNLASMKFIVSGIGAPY